MLPCCDAAAGLCWMLLLLYFCCGVLAAIVVPVLYYVPCCSTAATKFMLISVLLLLLWCSRLCRVVLFDVHDLVQFLDAIGLLMHVSLVCSYSYTSTLAIAAIVAYMHQLMSML
jgi:hypothetical protein